MRYWAELDADSTVVNVIVTADGDGGANFISSLPTDYAEMDSQASAGIGYSYDGETNSFISPKPFDSWVLDSNNAWVAPTPMPQDEKIWYWSEDALSWLEPVDPEV